MSKKIIYILIIIFFISSLGTIMFFYSKDSTLMEVTEVTLRSETIPAVVLIPNSVPATIIKNNEPEDSILISEVPNQIRADLLVEDKLYNVATIPGSTIYDVLTAIASTGALNFKTSHYVGLGYFIQEINGRKNVGGNYWVLYINGVYSIVGASQYVLKEGDKIEWKYEN